MSDALERARRAVLRAMRNKDAPPDDGGVYIYCWRDNDGVYDARCFSATRFALHDAEGCARWFMGKADLESLNPPHPSDREAIALLPLRLQKRIKKHEKQRTNEQTTEISEP